jgi:8-oxo-dGTP diphosphatase
MHQEASVIRMSAAHRSDSRSHQLFGDVHLLLMDPAGRALLGLRQNTGLLDGAYNLPSGHVQAGESAIQAAIREAREELGITVDPEHVEFAHVMHSTLTGGRASFYFRIRRWKGIPVNRERDTCSGLKWFPLDQLPDTLAGNCRAGLEHIAAGTPFSVWGWDTQPQTEQGEADRPVVRTLGTATRRRAGKPAPAGHPAA